MLWYPVLSVIIVLLLPLPGVLEDRLAKVWPKAIEWIRDRIPSIIELSKVGGWWFLLLWYGGVVLGLAGTWTDAFGLSIGPKMQLVLWLLAAIGMVLAPCYAFDRVRTQRDSLGENRHRELLVLKSIVEDLENLINRIDSDLDGVWTIAGSLLLLAVDHTELFGLTEFADIHARLAAARVGQLRWQQSVDNSFKDGFVAFISRMGQRTDRGIQSAFRPSDLDWGIQEFLRASKGRIGTIESQLPAHILRRLRD